MRTLLPLLVVLIVGCAEPTATNPPPQSPKDESGQQQGQSSKAPASVAATVRISALPTQIQTTPESKIYVFLRPKGQRMPLGVEQLAPNALPMDVMFTHPDSPETEYEIVARLSLTGKVNRSDGDLEHVLPITLNKAHNLQLSVEFNADTPQLTGNLPPGHPPVPTNRPNSGHIIPVQVRLSAEIELSERAVVFVIARDAQSAGIPLAVKRIQPTELPKLIMLSDADAMLSMNRISQRKQFELLARLSQTGNASLSPGDIESEIFSFSWTEGGNDSPIELNIQVSPES